MNSRNSVRENLVATKLCVRYYRAHVHPRVKQSNGSLLLSVPLPAHAWRDEDGLKSVLLPLLEPTVANVPVGFVLSEH